MSSTILTSASATDANSNSRPDAKSTSSQGRLALGCHPNTLESAVAASPPVEAPLGYPPPPAPMSFLAPATLSRGKGLASPLIRRFPPVVPQQASRSHLTPAVFQNRKLRSGKWIQEEDKYADVLIELFEKGLINECENGCTLRSFLSRRLHCAPMRISKKYAGRGIGKMVYLSKLNVGIPAGQEERPARDTRTKTFEEAFHKAVFPGGDYHDSFGTLSRISVSQPPSSHIPIVPGLIPDVAPTMFHFPIPAFAPNGIPKPDVLPIATSSVSTAAQMPAPPPSATTATDDQKKALHKSFVNAMKETRPPSQKGSAAASYQGASSLTDSAAEPAIHQLSTVPSTHSSEVPDFLAGFDTLAASQPSGAHAMARASEVPDFLTGFDKLAASQLSGAHVASRVATTESSMEGSLQYSPPFTSRSFDDFHRFLGTDWSLLEDASEMKTSSTVGHEQKPHSLAKPSLPPPTISPLLDTTALFAADSYAMFAQETAAIAASQHAAYLPYGYGPPSAADGAGAFDIDGLMQLVSTGNSEKLDNAPGLQAILRKPSNATTHVRLPNILPRPLKAATQVASEQACSSVAMTPMERLCGTRNYSVVSGSDPSSSATESDSSERCGSDNISNTDNGSNDSEGNSDCAYEEPPQRKKRKIIDGTQPCKNTSELQISSIQ